MKPIIFLHGGAHFQLATLADPFVRNIQVHPVHIRDREQVLDALTEAEEVFVADRLRPDLLLPLGRELCAVRERGGSLVVSGENDLSWLPGFEVRRRPTVFWWWRTGEDSLLRIQDAAGDYADYFSPKALVWHYHGVLSGPEGAVSLVDKLTDDAADRDGSTILIDESGAGRVLVTTMDPVYHHGSGFMPGATQLLYGALRWLRKE